jgi:hypothetical protein
MVFFPGSNDPDNPRVYPLTTTLTIPENVQVRFAPNAELLRLPSEGRLILMENGSRLSGAIVNGNKYAHWPQFPDLGKGDFGVLMKSHCLVEDCVVYDNPGIAFGTYANGNRVYRCRAENAGYIEVKHGAMFYQGKWDKWSGDGFYMRGRQNLIKDCHAYDCQRWDYTSPHSGAGEVTYVDCLGGNVDFRTYGFIDIEDAEEGCTLIRCKSPNSGIAIPATRRVIVRDCMASDLVTYDRENPDAAEKYGGLSDNPRIEGCIFTDGGITIGGYSSLKGVEKMVFGTKGPIVLNNIMYKHNPRPNSAQNSDYSFSVHSIDGQGRVANNILYEYDDGRQRGPGMRLYNVPAANNRVVYGQWKRVDVRPRPRYGRVDKAFVERRRKEIGSEMLPGSLEEAGVPGRIARAHWLPFEAKFRLADTDDVDTAGWESGLPEPRKMPVGEHWDFTIDGTNGPGWYEFQLDWPQVAEGNELYLVGLGIDSEAEVYLEGKKIARHSGWRTPLAVQIPAGMRNGKTAKLVLKVWTPSGMGGLYRPMALVEMAGQ